jgi:hypothetical protein
MSRTCGCRIVVQPKHERPLDLLRLLIDDGWSFDAYRQIMYLPLGDHDAFDWQHCPAAEWPQLLKMFEQKQAAGERLGIALFWQDSAIGGTFHCEPDHVYPGAIQI